MQSLQNAVVVVVGASSGIGRATALAFAERGARVVLAARRGDLLQEVAEACRARGGQAIAVPTDVTVASEVETLALATMNAFGQIDVWINNVGTGVFGPYQAAAPALHRRVIETNLVGAMNGVSAVLPIFLRQAKGTLINMVSMGGWAPTPFAAAYTASKFGLRGLAAALRTELSAYPHIHVCSVFPGLVDTPGLAHGANVSGRVLSPSGPFLAPETVGEVIVQLALHPRREVAVGAVAWVAKLAWAVAPGPTEWVMGVVFRRYLRRAEPARHSVGALMAPVADGRRADGGWRSKQGTVTATELAGFTAAGAAVVLALGLVARQRRVLRPQ